MGRGRKTQSETGRAREREKQSSCGSQTAKWSDKWRVPCNLVTVRFYGLRYACLSELNNERIWYCRFGCMNYTNILEIKLHRIRLLLFRRFFGQANPNRHSQSRNQSSPLSEWAKCVSLQVGVPSATTIVALRNSHTHSHGLLTTMQSDCEMEIRYNWEKKKNSNENHNVLRVGVFLLSILCNSYCNDHAFGRSNVQRTTRSVIAISIDRKI